MSLDKLPLSGSVVVRPGDTLIVRVAGSVTKADADRLRGELEDLLPGVQLVVAAHMEQLIVYRPSAAAWKLASWMRRAVFSGGS